MRKFSSKLAGQQAGFTLIELVIVIVIIGILAAVAIPNLSNTTEEARKGKAMATLGALKGAWGIAYATVKSAPTCAAIASTMTDPTCGTGGTGITCTGVTLSGGSGNVNYVCSGAPTSPAQITCSTADCG